MDYVAVATIVLYLGGVTAVGALMVRRTRGSVEWAVAGGGMSGALVAFALAGTRIGGRGHVRSRGRRDQRWHLEHVVVRYQQLCRHGVRGGVLRRLLPEAETPDGGGALRRPVRVPAVPVAHELLRPDRERDHQRDRSLRDRGDTQFADTAHHVPRRAHRRRGLFHLRVPRRDLGDGRDQRHPHRGDPGLATRSWRLGHPRNGPDGTR